MRPTYGTAARSTALPMRLWKLNWLWLGNRVSARPPAMRTSKESSMHTAPAFSVGEYLAIPIAESLGDGQWKAGLAISEGQARGDRPAKCMFAKLFMSRDDALQFAIAQWQQPVASH